MSRSRTGQPENDPVFRFDSPWLRALADGAISKTGYLIVQMILSFNAVGRPCWASNAYVARALGIDPRTAANEISRLHKQGWLKRPANCGPKRHLFINTEVTTNPAPDRHKKCDAKPPPGAPDHKKCEHKRLRKSSKPSEESGEAECVRRTHSEPRASVKAFGDDTPASRTAGDHRVDPEPLVAPRPSGRDKRPKPTRQPTEERHRELADRIKRFAARNRYVLTTRANWWAPAVALMERQLAKQGVSWAQIVELWEWHESQWQRDGYEWPHIRNAREFYDRFADVLDKRAKREKTQPVAPDAMPPDVRRALDQLEPLEWDKGAERSLPRALAQSFANLKAFTDRLAAASLPNDLKGARSAVLDCIGHGGVEYLVEWFEDLRRASRKWPHFAGDLTRFSWREDRPHFVGVAKTKVEEHCGDPDAYDRLLAALTPTAARTK